MKTEPNDLINAFEEVNGTIDHYRTHYGLTKREHFAAMAMQGYLANYAGLEKSLAELSVDMADALIAELNKERT